MQNHRCIIIYDFVTDCGRKDFVHKSPQQKQNTPAGMPQGPFLGLSLKRMLDVYEDTEVCREDYLFS